MSHALYLLLLVTGLVEFEAHLNSESYGNAIVPTTFWTAQKTAAHVWFRGEF